MIKKVFAVTLTLVVIACSPVKHAEKTNRKAEISVYAGINKGGITENTDVEQLENTSVDAYSGATQTGVNVGTTVQLPVLKNQVETGLTLMWNPKTMRYNDTYRNYYGTRAINLYQLMIPITYNAGIFRSKYPHGLLQFKIGYLMQFNFLSAKNTGTQLPGYSVNGYSGGPTFGLATTPFALPNGNSIGVFLDVYRGTQIYKDIYNKSTFEEPGSSFLKAGIVYRFKN
ncbi:MAG: hypothetical protein PF489_03745 [Salinivirgaceae bacterium]|jgi:hypothetical protein|nr:hypothetical protein [Salinivirgaceae bacterium]